VASELNLERPVWERKMAKAQVKTMHVGGAGMGRAWLVPVGRRQGSNCWSSFCTIPASVDFLV
jgi:hypothetical protein